MAWLLPLPFRRGGLGRGVRIGPRDSAAEEFIGASSPKPSPPSGEEREKPPHLKLTDTGERERVDIILPNPPFGGEEEKGIQGNFPEDRQNAEIMGNIPKLLAAPK